MSVLYTPPMEQMPDQPPERFQLGEIITEKALAPADLGIPDELAPGAVVEVVVSDPYFWNVAIQDPEAVADMERIEQQAEEMAARRLADGHWKREPGTAYVDPEMNVQQKGATEFGDPVTAKWLFESREGLRSDALKAWKELIPSATALMYLSDPETPKFVVSPDGTETPIDENARKRWATCKDGVNIRTRGTTMAEEVVDYVEKHPELRQGMRWMSVACGTAVPAMQGSIKANVSPELTLLDIDKNAMQSTQELAGEIGFTGEIKQLRKNIFNPNAMAKLRDELMEGGVDRRPNVIDAMGITEYTGELLGVDTAEFLRSMWDLLKPGGRLIFGQMLDSRPVPNFTMGGIQWPYVSMRSPAEMMGLIQKAGIPTECFKMIVQENGVYMVLSGDKPLETTAANVPAAEVAMPAEEVPPVDVVRAIVEDGAVHESRLRRAARRVGHLVNKR